MPALGLTRGARSIDRALGRLRGGRTVLIEARTPLNLAVLRPVYEALARDPRIRLRFTAVDRPDIRQALGQERLLDRFVSRRRAAFMRVDLYVNADPWDPVRLFRCAESVTFFHGVAGKYDLDRPVGLPLGLHRYSRVAFNSAGRMRNYLDAGLVAPGQAALIGYPKVDALVAAPGSPPAARAAVGLEPERPAALYGPTFSPASSLHLAGEAIVRSLLDAELGVMIKLHDRSLDPDPRYSGGIDWPRRLAPLLRPGRCVLAPQSDALPYMRAADLLVTDHSSLGFEFCLLDRPIVVYDAPDLARLARISPEKTALLRRVAAVVRSPEELAEAVRDALARPRARAAERRAAAEACFHQPGKATGRAVALIYELLDVSRPGAAPALQPAELQRMA